MDLEGSSHNDQRGHQPPPNKTTEESLALVWEHISSFPKYKSRYSRSDNPKRRYLSPDLSINRMYELHKEHCSRQGVNPVSKWVVFNKEFNLSFGRYVDHPELLLAHTHTCMHTHTHMHATRTFTHTHTPPMHSHMQHAHAHTHTHTCTRTHACTCKHMHTRTCMHAHVHIHTCTCAPTHAHSFTFSPTLIYYSPKTYTYSYTSESCPITGGMGTTTTSV